MLIRYQKYQSQPEIQDLIRYRKTEGLTSQPCLSQLKTTNWAMDKDLRFGLPRIQQNLYELHNFAAQSQWIRYPTRGGLTIWFKTVVVLAPELKMVIQNSVMQKQQA